MDKVALQILELAIPVLGVLVILTLVAGGNNWWSKK